MKKVLLICFGCYSFLIACTGPKVSGTDYNAKGDTIPVRIENWLDSTDIYFPVDSLRTSHELSISFIEEEFQKRNIKYCDETKAWAKTALSHIITYGGRQKDNFQFYYVIGEDPRSSLVTAYIGQNGFVYGADLLHQLYSMLNFESSEPYKQVITISIPANGASPFGADFHWSDSGLVGQSNYLKATALVMKKENNRFSSNSIRDCISVAAKFLKLTNSQLEEIASDFLTDYYKKKFATSAALTWKAPPTVSVKKVKGFITNKDGYWEEDDIKIDNIQPCEGKKLLVQCTIDGFYIRVKTDNYERSAFEKVYVLQRDYSDEINAHGLIVIHDFREYLKSK